METTIISVFGFIITLLVIIIRILIIIRKDTDKIRYYGIYSQSSDKLLKIFWIYKRELTYSEIIKIKKDYRMFKNEEVVVRQLDDYQIAEFTGYNITK